MKGKECIISSDKRGYHADYSAVYTGSGKTKAGKELYRSYLCIWLEQDKDNYLAAVAKVSKDMRKKIFAVLKREGLYKAYDMER